MCYWSTKKTEGQVKQRCAMQRENKAVLVFIFALTASVSGHRTKGHECRGQNRAIQRDSVMRLGWG